MKDNNIMVKHSIVKIVISVKCYYLEKSGILFNLVILEGEDSGNQNDITFILTLREVFFNYLEHKVIVFHTDTGC